MLALRIILCILAVIVFLIGRFIENKKVFIALQVVGIILVVAFSIILIKTNWNGFAILKILSLSFICICLSFVAKTDDLVAGPATLLVLIPGLFMLCAFYIIIYCIVGIVYERNIKDYETSDISVEKVEIFEFDAQ